MRDRIELDGIIYKRERPNGNRAVVVVDRARSTRHGARPRRARFLRGGAGAGGHEGFMGRPALVDEISSLRLQLEQAQARHRAQLLQQTMRADNAEHEADELQAQVDALELQLEQARAEVAELKARLNG